MQFLKNHYEKIILSIVLLGLTIAAAALPVQVSRVRQYLDDTKNGIVRTKAKPFKPIEISTNQAVVKRLQQPVEIRLSGLHNVFNPVEWKKKADGSLIKVQTGSEIGPGALQVTNIHELRLTINFEPAPKTDANEQRYKVTVHRETDPKPKIETRVATRNVPNDIFTILQIDGPPENPNALVVQLKDDNQAIRVPREQGFSDIVGYAADLFYPVEKQSISRKRVKDTVKLENDPETYKIVAIDPTEVVLSAEPSQKRTTIKLKSAPQQ